MASCLFALGATSVVWLGLKATGVAEKYLSSGMTAMLILLVGASLFSARVPVADILYAHWTYAVPVFNIAVFCYAVQYIVPEISRGFTHDPGKSSRPSWPGPAFPSSSWLWSPWRSSSCCQSMKFRKSHPCLGAVPGISGLLRHRQRFRFLCHAHIVLGHCRKLLDQYDRPPGL